MVKSRKSDLRKNRNGVAGSNGVHSHLVASFELPTVELQQVL